MIPQGLVLNPVMDADFEAMTAIRIEAMRESLERLGRFDSERARERLCAGFVPTCMHHICLASGEKIGFVTLKPESHDALRLDHLYILPTHQSKGIGAWVIDWAKSQAQACTKNIKVTVLKQSDAIRFYEMNGFKQDGEEEWDLHYQWQVEGPAS